jgi:hypothetical protein
MKTRQKRPVAGPTTGCCANQASCIEEKQRVRQPAVRSPHEKKPKKEQIYTYTHTQVRMLVSAVRYTQKNKQTNIHTCVSVYACVYEERERIRVTLVYCVCLSAGAHRDTHTHTHPHTPTHTHNTKNTDKNMSSNDRTPTLSLEHSITVPSHKKHAHSLQR